MRTKSSQQSWCFYFLNSSLDIYIWFVFLNVLLIPKTIGAQNDENAKQLIEKWHSLENDSAILAVQIEADLTLRSVSAYLKSKNDIPNWANCGYEAWKVAFRMGNDTLLLHSLTGMRDIYHHAKIPMFEKLSFEQTRKMLPEDAMLLHMQLDTANISLFLQTNELDKADALIDKCITICKNEYLEQEELLRLDLAYKKAKVMHGKKLYKAVFMQLDQVENLANLCNRHGIKCIAVQFKKDLKFASSLRIQSEKQNSGY